MNGEIVNPAIYELRYAGRRITEALANETEDEIKKLLNDALFDCCRARHDAIDAATSKMSADLDIAVEKLGADLVLANFPDLAQLISDLGDVRDKIALSRENRDDRDAIYAVIQGQNLSDMVKVYRKFLACEPLLKATAKKQRAARVRNSVFGWGGLILAIFSVIFAIYTYHFPSAGNAPTVEQTPPSAQN